MFLNKLLRSMKIGKNKKITLISFILFYIINCSFSNDKEDAYIIHLRYPSSNYEVFILFPCKNITKPLESNSDKLEFSEYLLRKYQCTFLLNDFDDVYMYGCCEFKNVNKAEELVLNKTIDSMKLYNYSQICLKFNHLENLFNNSKKGIIKIGGVDYELSIIKGSTEYCKCPTFAYGGNITAGIDSVGFLKEFKEISFKESKTLKKIICKFNNFK
jgi:hypothetical protein